MDTVKITATAKVAKVTSETIANDGSITEALETFALFGKKNGEVGIRTYGFLASVVELTDTKATDMVETHGADAGRLSKAGKCLRFVVSEILTPEVVTAESYDSAIEYLVETYGSLNGAYSDLFPSAKKKNDPTLADMVANLYKWADKNGITHDEVLAEVTRQA